MSTRSNIFMLMLAGALIFSSLSEAEPLSAEDWFKKGAGLQEAEKYNEAIDAYDKAIKLKPDYAEAYSNRGLAYQDLGQFERAIKDYDKAIIDICIINATIMATKGGVRIGESTTGAWTG